MVWGDSLSAGYGLQADEAWPTLLQTRLEEKGFRHTVVNASVSGETSAGGRSRLPAALEQHEPDIVILELGANDGLRGLPPKLLAENLDAMISAAQGAGAQVLLVGMQMPPNYGAAYGKQFADLFGQVAKAHGAALVPFMLKGVADQADAPKLFQADRIHPTAEAHPTILANIYPSLRKTLP